MWFLSIVAILRTLKQRSMLEEKKMIKTIRTTQSRALIATLFGLFAIAGCHKIVGGGWMDGLYGGKATLGF